jgi:hypothetical protein
MSRKKNKYFLFIFLSINLCMTNAFAETPGDASPTTVLQPVYNESQAGTPQDTLSAGHESAPVTYSGPFPKNPGEGGFVLETDHLGGSLSTIEAVYQEGAGGTVSLASVNYPNITMNGLSLYKNFNVNGHPFVLRIKTRNNDDLVNLENGNIRLSEFYARTLNIPNDKGDIVSISNTFKQQPDLLPALTPFTQVPLNADKVKMNAHSLRLRNLSISHFEMRIEPGQQTTSIP